ncbi:hypothetical protein SI859A1_01112 [Aurantimonas manganoxydans SI85-9A1]|uniref:Uncharacterized protein n=1 Tax=Aurantimonas manganoxydans (strain ATCC BAA-1229 / DSM 21871 / SI85-9A1) TaxID=287752 RepID=Q1YEG3_AURMS|nr:hypothetical protein SI859A1_01112 [Aurantimonas manganoxydans SI85-9A1]
MPADEFLHEIARLGLRLTRHVHRLSLPVEGIMRGRVRKRRSTRRVLDGGVRPGNAKGALRGDRRPGRMGRRSPVSSEAILAGVVGRAETADAAGTQRVRNALRGAAGELDATPQQASPAEGLADAARIRDEGRSAHDRSRLHGGSHDDFGRVPIGGVARR